MSLARGCPIKSIIDHVQAGLTIHELDQIVWGCVQGFVYCHCRLAAVSTLEPTVELMIV